MQDIIISDRRFAEERHSITDWVTPNAAEVQDLFPQLQQLTPLDTTIAVWQWIEDHVSYPYTRCGKHIDHQKLIAFRTFYYVNVGDFWNFPCEVIARARAAGQAGKKIAGDCEDRAVVVASILRNQLSPSEVYVAIGNYLYPTPSGHAWVKCQLDGFWYIVDPTLPAGMAAYESDYDEYVLFNDVEVIEHKPIEGVLGKKYSPKKMEYVKVWQL